MEVSKKLNNYLCTRCKYKHNSAVPCACCDGVSEFVEQSRSKYRDGLDAYVDAQKYCQWNLDLLGDVYRKEKEEMSKGLKVKVSSVELSGIHGRFSYPQMAIEAEVISLPNGILTSRKDDFRRDIENLLNSRVSYGLPEIKNVIFNNPATIVFWADGTKTVVKCQEGDIFDPEKGLTMAITKKALGNKYEWYNTIKKYTKRYYKQMCVEACDNFMKNIEEDSNAR